MILSRSAFSAISLILLLHGSCGATNDEVTYSGRIPNGQNNKIFGCVFENEDLYVHTNSKFDPVYGEKVEPMNFNNTKEFNQYLNIINNLYGDLMEKFVYNNIPEFFDFYDAFEMVPEYEKTNWFEKYVPKLTRQECTGMAIEMLNRLIQQYPRMRRSVHLISGDLDAERDLLDALGIEWIPTRKPSCLSGVNTRHLRNSKMKSYTQRPPKAFDHMHVAALLRFRLPGNRLGYVLMDLAIGLEKPVVIMEDRRPPHQPRSLDYARIMSKNKPMEVSLPRREYLLATASELDFGKQHRKFLYYIARPYCSFLMSTTKAHIMNGVKNVLRHDRTGLAIASIKFDLSMENPEFKMALRSQVKEKRATIYNEEKHVIPFGNRSQLSGDIKEFYNKVIESINIHGLEEMLEKVEHIAKDVLFQACRQALQIERENQINQNNNFISSNNEK